MQCPYCDGTMRECGCGQGKCAHCINGEVLDFPCGQERHVPAYLSREQVLEFAKYWFAPNRLDNLGEFIQRVAAQGVQEYKNAIMRAGGDCISQMADLVAEGLEVERAAKEANQSWGLKHDQKEEE